MRLVKDTSHRWQLRQKNTQFPRYADLEAFLASRCVAVESSDQILYNVGGCKSGSIPIPRTKKVALLAGKNDQEQCFYCSGQHRLFSCDAFKKLDVSGRVAAIREKKLCYNFLSLYHLKEHCKSKFSCQVCEDRHNTLIHSDTPVISTAKRPSSSSLAKEDNATKELASHLSLSVHGGGGHVFLATASVLVSDNRGEFKECRAILDSGSQINFISKDFANLLQLPRKKTMLPVSGIGANYIESGSCMSIRVKSRVKRFQMDLVCYVLPVIAKKLPGYPVPSEGWSIPTEIEAQVADPDFSKARSVDFLIGGGVFFDLLGTRRKQLPSAITIQETVLGWVVTGEVGATCLLSASSFGQEWESDFRAIYRSEDQACIASKSNQRCIEEQQVLRHFKSTSRRDEEGRFVLWLPFKPEVQELGKTLDMARSYRLTTVSGTTSASFMATNCLVSLAEEVSASRPEVARIIRHDFYMDDLMTGSDTIEECCQRQRAISGILSSARFPLRKWCSNSSEVMARTNKRCAEPLFVLKIGEDDIVKSLGFSWKPVADEFRFEVGPSPTRHKVTKRMLLSDLYRIFDPLGFLAPVLVRGKIFIQQLWQLKLEWDNTLSDDLGSRWRRFYQELDKLGCLPIPRKCIPSLSEEFEVHGFCDASQEAYGAATRVVPLRGLTIPRLELGGALTLARLALNVAEAWKLEVRDYYLWTDSTVVISWLNAESCRLKAFVANRVDQILEITKAQQWRHVQTNENPADILSRGIATEGLQKSVLWWNGLCWLTMQNIERRKEMYVPNCQEFLELRQVRLTLTAIHPLNGLFHHYSDWRRLLGAVAWLKRFLKFLKEKKRVQFPRYLTAAEYKEAEIVVLIQVQEEAFAEEISALRKGKDIARSSKLKGLLPYLSCGMIFVGGRSQHASIPERQKHPA
ncbi:Peptidase aspartic, putative,Retrotransposon, Pao,Aspartic peptidase domain [Cinara cedri]|uniref:Peptidase aspartic, putative,Retrotransposon, Pao,Aspartic peptidase domain n=1 Tax=Cinara cedri TaxID=506608 RepID=A0A5E4M694_9HEMI|nr:Peptidase aspartic, putative,Retrotransposon, Pao,Aspartic peptidase domain [Cinara cedri]